MLKFNLSWLCNNFYNFFNMRKHYILLEFHYMHLGFCRGKSGFHKASLTFTWYACVGCLNQDCKRKTLHQSRETSACLCWVPESMFVCSGMSKRKCLLSKQKIFSQAFSLRLVSFHKRIIYYTVLRKTYNILARKEAAQWLERRALTREIIKPEFESHPTPTLYTYL